MVVSREQLEEHLARVKARVRDPQGGLFGPGSMVWLINREQMMFLAGGRAALLQEAHPFVAQGVDQHSLTRTDPRGRFERTFKNVYAMIFGDLDRALEAARRVHAVHERIRGTMPKAAGAFAEGSPYEANAEHALLWVHATLWESSVKVFEMVFRPLSRAEKERYYAETKLFAYMFGVGDDPLPPRWDDFVAYNERMWRSDQLFVTKAAREMAGFLFTPASRTSERLLSWYEVMTAGLLPRSIRAQYGFAFGSKERAVFEASIRGLRAAVRLVPRNMRYITAYQRARARVGRPIVPTLAERVVNEALSVTSRRAA